MFCTVACSDQWMMCSQGFNIPSPGTSNDKFALNTVLGLFIVYWPILTTVIRLTVCRRWVSAFFSLLFFTCKVKVVLMSERERETCSACSNWKLLSQHVKVFQTSSFIAQSFKIKSQSHCMKLCFFCLKH